MSPRLMLSLWRERWGKAGDGASKRPYLEGVINHWSDRLTAAQVWSLPGVLKVTILLSLLALTMVVTVDLSLNSQLVFAGLVVAASMYARRYAGPWVTLGLAGLWLIASARYFFWRFDATLSPSLDMALVLGFALCAAELHLWALKVVDLLSRAFPLKRTPVPLPSDPRDWPTVDVFIPCHGLSGASIERAAQAVKALDWPSDKIKRYLIDDSATGTRQQLARTMGLIYLSVPSTDADKIGAVSHILPVTQGDWIVVLDGHCTPDKHLLVSVAGWAVADTTLGMVQTAGHFLAPPPSRRSLAVLEPPEPGCSFALIRRKLLTKAGGVASGPVTEKAHIAIQLESLGWRTAYVGFASSQSQESDFNHSGQGIGQPGMSGLDVFLVDQPFSEWALCGRQCVGALQDRLEFYRLMPWMILFITPLVYLLAGVNPIQSSPELLLAYLFPHWFHGYMAQARFESKTRFNALEELKEMALGLCVLCATAISVIRTEYSRWLAFPKVEKIPRSVSAYGFIAWPYGFALVLTLLGFMSGLLQFLMPGPVRSELATVYWAWSGYNVLLLAALLAVGKESQHIRQQMSRQARRPATLRLPSGHAIACVTINFPASLLALEQPVPTTVEEGERVHVSMFRHHREFVFPAQVMSCNGNTICVSIEEAGQSAYLALAAVTFARGPDWPKWLPGRDADQPFPPWAIKLFVMVRVAASSAKNRLGDFLRWVLLGGWMQSWKK